MPHELSRIVSGNPTPSTAMEWNQLIDAQQEVATTRQFSGSPNPAHLWWNNTVQVQNKTGVPIDVGEILILQEPLTDPQFSSDVFRKRPIMVGIKNSWSSGAEDHWGKIAIATQPMAPDDIGWAHYTGVARAYLSKRYQYHDHCDIGNADEPYLVSHPSGSWQILWTMSTPPGTTPEWAVVRHRGIWDRTLQGTARADIAGGASGNVEIRFAGSLTGEIVNAQYRWSGGPSISNGDTVELEWQSDELVWTVAKIGTTGGVIDPTVAASFRIDEDDLGSGSGGLTLTPGYLSDASGDIALNAGNVEVNSQGFYEYSYNLVITPGSLTQYSNEVQIDKSQFDAWAIGGVSANRQIEQTCTPLFWSDGSTPTDPSNPYTTAETTIESISGSGIFETGAGGGVFVLWYNTNFTVNVDGDVHVTRHRKF